MKNETVIELLRIVHTLVEIGRDDAKSWSLKVPTDYSDVTWAQVIMRIIRKSNIGFFAEALN